MPLWVSLVGINWTLPLHSFIGKRKEEEERGKRERKKDGRRWGNRKRKRKKTTEKGERKEQLIYFLGSKFRFLHFLSIMKHFYCAEWVNVMTDHEWNETRSLKWNKIIFCTLFPDNYFSSSWFAQLSAQQTFPPHLPGCISSWRCFIALGTCLFSKSQEQPPSKGASPWILWYSPILYSKLSLLSWTKDKNSSSYSEQPEANQTNF